MGFSSVPPVMEFCSGNHTSPSQEWGQESLIAFLCPFQWGGKTSDGITKAINLNKRNIPDMGKQCLTSVKPQNVTNLLNAQRNFFLPAPFTAICWQITFPSPAQLCPGSFVVPPALPQGAGHHTMVQVKCKC